MRRQRRNLSGPGKMALLREYLIAKVPVSEVCEKHGFEPTLFCDWRKKRFEDRKCIRPGKLDALGAKLSGNGVKPRRQRLAVVVTDRRVGMLLDVLGGG